MPCHLERILVNNQRETSRVTLLTQILREYVYSLENLLRCRPSRVVSGPPI